jgi:hypothetical protein
LKYPYDKQIPGSKDWLYVNKINSNDLDVVDTNDAGDVDIYYVDVDVDIDVGL